MEKVVKYLLKKILQYCNYITCQIKDKLGCTIYRYYILEYNSTFNIYFKFVYKSKCMTRRLSSTY